MKKYFYGLFEFCDEVEFPILYLCKGIYYLRLCNIGDEIVADVIDYKRNCLFSFNVIVSSRSIRNNFVKKYQDTFTYYPDELERFSPAIIHPCHSIDEWKRYISASLRVYIDLNLI